MSAIDTFNRLAPKYDVWYTTPLGAFVDAQEKGAVFGLAGVRPEERVLDVGCGTGNYTLELARRLEQGSLLRQGDKETRGQGEGKKGKEVTLSPPHPCTSAPPHLCTSAQVVGVDPAPAMLVVATGKAKEAGLSVCFAQAVAEDLPFPTGSFDLVVSVTTLEFVASPQAAVAEMVRVLRTGGRLVIGVLNAWSLWALAYRQRTGSVYEHAHFFSPLELVGLLRPYGRVIWSSCVFVPPWHAGNIGPPVRALERVGRRWLRPFGAFLVARVR